MTAGVPDGRLARLRFAIRNLFDDFGSTDSVGLGLVINLGLAAIGVVVWWATTGVVAFVGAVWAILNLLGIVAWVLRL